MIVFVDPFGPSDAPGPEDQRSAFRTPRVPVSQAEEARERGTEQDGRRVVLFKGKTGEDIEGMQT